MTILTSLILLVLSIALWMAAYERRMSAAILISFWIGWNVQSLLRLLSEYDFSSIMNFFSF